VLDLDKTIHEPVRLKIMMILSGVDFADFCSICQTLQLTNGNLSAHISKLEAARYVRVKKTIVGKVPHTEFCLTKKGRKALAAYLDCFDQIRRLSVIWTTKES
jgi:DNA-binding transcriptional ArsR family regulator